MKCFQVQSLVERVKFNLICCNVYFLAFWLSTYAKIRLIRTMKAGPWGPSSTTFLSKPTEQSDSMIAFALWTIPHPSRSSIRGLQSLYYSELAGLSIISPTKTRLLPFRPCANQPRNHRLFLREGMNHEAWERLKDSRQ